MPRIQSVSVCIARVPLDTVTSFATRTVSSRDYCLVNFRRMIDNQLKHKDGNLILHETPGLGFNFDEKAVKKYALTPAKPWTVVKHLKSPSASKR